MPPTLPRYQLLLPSIPSTEYVTTGGVVSINPDGSIAHDPGNDGTWECTDRARGQATLRWRLGGYVNRLVLSGDGRALSSTDPTQSYVTARKVDAPRSAEA